MIGAVFARQFVSDGHVLFLVFAVGSVVVLGLMWKATTGAVVLPREGIFDQNGQSIAPIEQIDRLVTGHFTFRPSNGFSLRLKQSVPTRWQPGLWWSFGQRVGVGGLAAGRRTKAFAEALDALLNE
jgi:hypothetical protein